VSDHVPIVARSTLLAAAAKALDEETSQLLADCEARESRLTEWERGFVQSLRERVDAGRGLSTKQAEMLDEIWERATARG
jgi:hypothetical protein